MMRAPEFWRRSPPSRMARLLAPYGSLYGAAAERRMARDAPRAGLPTVVIGGPTVGGDGKTPMALAMAAILETLGEKPVFLTRGFGRGRSREREPFLVDAARHGARAAGDEALLLARAAPTIVCADRAAGARFAETLGASALVLDDGLHSRALAPDLALAAVDSHYGAGNGLCLPAGPLRAPLKSFFRRVDAVVMIGDGREGAAMGRDCDEPWLRARVIPDPQSVERLCGKRIFSFAGIARPEKFAASLREIGADIVGSRWFPDHHFFASTELAQLARKAQELSATLVTTEKDATRLAVGERSIETLSIRLLFDAPERIAALTARALERARLIRGA
jgi:tetraacyldisaccharide 4'-kinase